jgi:hypothetical protein
VYAAPSHHARCTVPQKCTPCLPRRHTERTPVPFPTRDTLQLGGFTALCRASSDMFSGASRVHQRRPSLCPVRSSGRGRGRSSCSTAPTGRPGARVTRPKPAVTHGVNNAFIRTWRRSQPDSRVTLGKGGVCASHCLGGTPHCPQCVLPVRTHEGGRPPVVTHSESVTNAIVTHVLLAVECHGDRWLHEPGTCERALVLYSSPASSSAGGARVAAQALQSVFVELHSSEERAMRHPSHPLRASSPWACLAVVRSYDRAHHQWWRPLVVRGGCSQHATAGRIRGRPQQSRRG